MSHTPQHPQSHHPSAPSASSERLSIAAFISLILGLLTLPGVFCCVGYGTGIIGIVLGLVGLVQVRNGEANQTSKILSIAGVATSGFAILLHVVLMAVGIASQPDYSTLEDPDSVFESSSSSVTEAEDPREDAIEVTAAELVEAYEKNEVQADETYEGQWVEVTGTVGDIKKDITDSVYVTIGKGEQFEVRQVQCFVDEGVDVTDLSKGDRITMTGRVDGLMMNVLVEECR